MNLLLFIAGACSGRLFSALPPFAPRPANEDLRHEGGLMAYDVNWSELCRRVRVEADSCALACPARAADFQTEAESFCAQAVPQSSPEMQMRHLSFAGIQGVWAARTHPKEILSRP